MRRPPLLRSLLLLVLTCLGVTALCAAPPASSLGLQMNLVTSLASFTYPPETPQTAAQRRAERQETFTASASLTNLGRSAVTITYPDANAVGARFSFKLLNAAGGLVWTSDAAHISTADPASFTLDSRAVLRKTVQVPLKSAAGQWLPAGHYTLRAEAGEGGALTAVPFDVVGDPLPAGTGIEGQVFFRDLSLLTTIIALPSTSPVGNGITPVGNGLGTLGNGTSVNVTPPVPIQATVSIWEVRDPNVHTSRPAFVWTGPTDSQGRFHVETPGGVFYFAASSPEIIEPSYLLPYRTQVTLTPGQFTRSNFTINGSRRNPGVPVYRVNSATVQSQGAGPLATLLIQAHGSATTTGWTEPKLVPRFSTAAGVLDLDFIAVAPTGAAGQAIVPIDVEKTLLNTGAWTTIRIHARRNSIDAEQVPAAN